MIRWKTGTAVIGAGAAGLAAASALHASGRDVRVFEARDRIGGRAHTIFPPSGGFAELGAEFIHGKPEEIFELLRATGTTALDVGWSMFEYRDGALAQAGDLWETTQRILREVDPSSPDCDVDTFLDSLSPQSANDGDKARVRALVEGFDAAITSDAGVHAIAQEWASETNSTEFRTSAGYAPLFAHLAAPVSERLHFGCVAQSIETGGGVSIAGERYGEPFQIEAQQCIVTVPVGVLHAGGIRFRPALPQAIRDAMDAIATGPVVKLILDFTEPFWETAEEGRFKDMAFLQNPTGAFRTFWTLLPNRFPRLIAWSGGGAVGRMKAHDIQGYVRCALDELGEMFPDARVREKFQAGFFHDWDADPYARGAYSYLRVNGAGARESLGTPVGPLIFAGEATAPDGESGTVGGALQGGYRAARLILERTI